MPSPIRKRFGQHFLEPAWVDKLIAAIAPQRDETFLEIGPGRGALTRPLAARAGRLVAIEIDRDLARTLQAMELPRADIVAEDFLEVSDSHLAEMVGAGPIRVAANLPYNVASPILFRLVALAPRMGFADATVMVQREVADRLTAAPGSREYGVLTVLIGHRAATARVLALPPGAFRPPPQVESAVIRLTFHPPDPPVADERLFASIVRAAFTRRRKTLHNALRAFTDRAASIDRAIGQLRLDPGRRPETLTIAEWASLAEAIGRETPLA